ncbi:MAG: hypothetical protein QXD62_03595 [Candidatus Woesearchaeota archaeon]
MNVEPSDNFCPHCGYNLKKDLLIKKIQEYKKKKQETLQKTKEENKELESKIDTYIPKKLKEEKEVKKENDKENEKLNLKIELDKLHAELDNLEQEKKRVLDEIDHLRTTVNNLKKRRTDLEQELAQLERKKEEIQRRESMLDKKEIELTEKEQALNQKYLELLQFENELIEKKKKLEENELSVFLATQLKDSSKLVAEQVVQDLKNNATVSETNKKEYEIIQLIDFAREFLNKGMIDAAIHVYKKIEELYYAYIHDLPRETIQKLHLKIIELYDDINIKLAELKHGK